MQRTEANIQHLKPEAEGRAAWKIRAGGVDAEGIARSGDPYDVSGPFCLCMDVAPLIGRRAAVMPLGATLTELATPLLDLPH